MKRAVLALAVVVVICWTALVLSGATLRGPDWDSCQSDLQSLTRATDDLSDQAGELSDLGQTVDQADDALESCETDSSRSCDDEREDLENARSRYQSAASDFSFELGSLQRKYKNSVSSCED